MFAVASSLMAQQIPLNSSTYFMRMLNNPALTAYNGSTNIYGYYRDQWVGMPGHPVTMGAMGEISLWGDRTGVGVAVSNDVTSIINNVSAQLYYAQKIKLAKDHHLALGVSFGLLNTHIDFANAIATDVNDPNILNATKSGVGFDMNVGIAYQWKKLTIGFAVPHIVNTNVTLSDQTKSSNYDAIRNYVANVSYEFSFKKETWNLEPSILFRKGTGSLYQIEGNVMANYKRIVFLGIGYRQDYGMTAQAAVRISRCVTLGYSYEYPIMGGVTYGNTKGTHEVLVGINFDRWIKNNDLKKLKKRVDTLETKMKEVEREDTVLTNKTDTLQQTKEDKDSAATKRDQQIQQNAIDTLARKVDELEQQIKEYRDYISKHRIDSFSNLKDVKEGDIIKLDKVYFETNSSYVKTESFSQLDKLAQLIKASPDMQVRILGHTDYIASDTYNMWLSERRAKHVADYLISRGVPAANISSAGYGKRSPIADNATEAGRALNRRVEIQILKK